MAQTETLNKLRKGLLWLALASALPLCGYAAAQTGVHDQLSQPASTLANSDAAVLSAMAARAGVIFAGHVVAVTRNDAAGFVDVRFHIDKAVRGCPESGAYVLREWAGLWSGHPDRYHVGDRRVMLLAHRGPSGMSAPIGGMDGAIPIVATAVEPIASAAGIAPRDTGAPFEPSVDLRWIQTRIVRSPLSTSASAMARSVSARIAPDDAWAGPVTPLSATPNGTIVSPFANLSAVLSALSGTGGGSNAER